MLFLLYAQYPYQVMAVDFSHDRLCQRIVKMTICPIGEKHATIMSDSFGGTSPYDGCLDVLSTQLILTTREVTKINSLPYDFHNAKELAPS